jgi:multisubunit Na+/H+ antiporter MnhC subunit
MRSTLSDGIKSLEKGYEKYYTDQLGQTKLNGAISVEDDTIQNKITIGETYTVSRIWKGDKQDQELEVFAKSISDRLPKPDKNTTTAPLALDYPLDLKYTMVLDMPSRFTLNADNFELKTASYAYSFKSENVGNKLLLIYTLKSFKDHIPGDEVAQYKEDYDKIFNTLDYTFTYNAASSSSNSRSLLVINWVAVLIFAMGLTILALLFRVFNRMESGFTSHTRMPQHMSGWPVLLAVFLCLSILINLISLAGSSYFSLATWKQLASSGGSTIPFLFMLDMLYNITVIAFSGALLYWYAHKRDIFPKMFIALGVLQLAMNLFTLAIGYGFSSRIEPYYPGYSKDSAAGVIFCMIFLGVWATALLKSPKTAKLFITPYQYRAVRHSSPFETLEAAREDFVERN